MMTDTMVLRRNTPTALFETVRSLLESIPLSMPQLLARLAIANIFWRSGQTKIANWDLTVQLFANEYGVPVLPPEMAASLATTFELACPILLVLGLATRLSVLPLIGMTAVSQLFVYPQAWTDHLTWFALLSFLLVSGPGNYSVDALIGRQFGFSSENR